MALSTKEWSEALRKSKGRIAERWKDRGFLHDLKENSLDLAVLLENARLRLMEGSSAGFNNLLIPITYLTFKNLVCRKLISLQPSLFEDGKYFYFDDVNDVQAEIKMGLAQTTTKSTDVKWIGDDVDYEDMKLVVAKIASILADWINHDIIKELSKKAVQAQIDCGDGSTKQKQANFHKVLARIVEEVGETNGRGPANWLVASPSLDVLLGNRFHDIPPTGISYIGKKTDVAYYRDSKMEAGQLLLGYKGENVYDAGLFYLPKLIVKSQDNFLCDVSDLVWYENGPSFYCKIIVTNLP